MPTYDEFQREQHKRAIALRVIATLTLGIMIIAIVLAILSFTSKQYVLGACMAVIVVITAIIACYMLRIARRIRQPR